MNFKYLYGPIPSRRLGFSLGISPIPKKTCNYSCVYCQLGRTNIFTNKRDLFYPIDDIINEFLEVKKQNLHFDVVSIVGEGEPTLYKDLGNLIITLKKHTDKPICVITNGATLSDKVIQDELMNADVVLPSLNAYDEKTFKQINRPYKNITFNDTYNGLLQFSDKFPGKIWLEVMLLDGINDDDESLLKFKEILKDLKYDRLYLNTPVRPPAEKHIKTVSHEKMTRAVEILGGISIDLLSNQLYQSTIEDDYEAIISNIIRHPMNQFEIEAFLKSRKVDNANEIFDKLNSNDKISKIDYKGFITYRLK